MDHVTALLERDDDPQTLAAARSVARLLGVATTALRLPAHDPAEAVHAAVRALGDEDVRAAALSARGADPVCWEVIPRVSVPLLLVPAHSDLAMTDVAKVLLPLDGSARTATAVSDIARQAVAAGASVAAVHVFDAANAPAFWDQTAHGHAAWSREFLDRHHLDGVELDLRRGRPADEVLAEADRWGADLIVMAWGHDLSAGHAATVRRALERGAVPVLLVSADPGPLPADPGPSAVPGAARPG